MRPLSVGGPESTRDGNEWTPRLCEDHSEGMPMNVTISMFNCLSRWYILSVECFLLDIVHTFGPIKHSVVQTN